MQHKKTKRSNFLLEKIMPLGVVLSHDDSYCNKNSCIKIHMQHKKIKRRAFLL
jgi:hypothetical protein